MRARSCATAAASRCCLQHRSPVSRPAVLFIHGGDWMGGNLNESGFIDHLRPALNRAGFVVAAINYRLAPRFKAPAQVEDTASAVRAPAGTGPAPSASTPTTSAPGRQCRPKLVTPHRNSTPVSRVFRRPLPPAVKSAAGGRRHVRNCRTSRPRSTPFGRSQAETRSPQPRSPVSSAPHRQRTHVRTWYGSAQRPTFSPGDPPFLILRAPRTPLRRLSQSQLLAAKLQAARRTECSSCSSSAVSTGWRTPGESPSEPQLVNQVVAWFSGMLTREGHSGP